jgi:hypothetical protein
MARNKKHTVDYFPHDCDHGKTMFILEQKYGNDGYAFWFKLLEMLGNSEGHFIDLKDPVIWEFLTSKTRVTDDLCEDILNLLARLKAIDPDLWEDKIIWSSNFVDRISDAYRNRASEIPTKPDFLRKKQEGSNQSDEFNPQNKNKNKNKNKIKEKEKEDSPDGDLPPQKTKKPKTKYEDSVWLTDEEYQKLQEAMGQKSLEIGIAKLDYSISVKGGKYKDHYKTLINWKNRGFLDADSTNNRPANVVAGTYRKPVWTERDANNAAAMDEADRINREREERIKRQAQQASATCQAATSA